MSTRILLSGREWALCGVTMVWGATFLFIRIALELTGPLFFTGMRFAAAAAILLVLALPVLGGITRRELFGGLAAGCVIFLGFASQTAGLASIEASRSAFITAFYVPLVPVLEWLLLRRLPSRFVLAGLALAFPGVALISAGGAQALDGFASFGRGELFTLLCAAAFALEIVMVGILAPGTSVRRFTFVELAATSLLSFACMPLAGEALSRNMLEPACLACGLGAATALLQSVVVWAQKSIPPSRATVIYTGEPVWGGFFGWLAGERLGAGALAGCALIVAGILISGKKGRPKAPERPSRKQSGARQSGAKPS